MRMREKVDIRERLSLERLRTASGSRQTLRSVVNSPRLFHRSRSDKVSPLEEEPETTLDLGDPRSASPYLHPARTHSVGSGGGGKSAFLLSPFATTSQVTLASPAVPPGPGDSTVRLVPDQQRFVLGHADGGSDSDSMPATPDRYLSSPSPSPGSDSESDRRWGGREGGGGQGGAPRESRGRSRTLSAVLSAYYHTMSREHSQERYRGARASVAEEPSSRTGSRLWQASPERYGSQVGPLESTPTLAPSPPPAHAPEEELSWTLTILLLMSVTVVSAVSLGSRRALVLGF